MVILSSYHPRAAPRTHVPITRWPFVFAKWRLRQASNSFTLPPFAALPSHGRSHPSRSSTSLPSPGVGEPLVSSPSRFSPFPRFFSLRQLARPSSSSTTTPPAPSLDHPPIFHSFRSTTQTALRTSAIHTFLVSPFLERYVYDYFAACYQPRERWERAIGCRFDPAFMDILLVY